MKTIVETAVEAGSFTVLVKALTAAGLVETLSGGEFTVFAPSDDAFAKIPEEVINAILADKERLTAILMNHVVEGKHMAAQVVSMSEVPTLQGGNLPVDTIEGVKIGTATVLTPDIECTNGVIHVIDSVLLPS